MTRKLALIFVALCVGLIMAYVAGVIGLAGLIAAVGTGFIMFLAAAV